MKKKSKQGENPEGWSTLKNETVIASIHIETARGGLRVSSLLMPNLPHRESEELGRALISLGESLL